VLILASQFQIKRMGRFIQGALAFGYGVSQTPIHWDPVKLLILPITMISGGMIFTALIVIGATICFWTIKTPEVINIFTFGGHQMTSYPLHIYEQWVRFVFLTIVPVAFANYPATLLLLDRAGPDGFPAQLAWGAPLAAALFFALAYRFWRFGVTKYQSTGS
jgi:ABC-2 type transport system permease protein